MTPACLYFRRDLEVREGSAGHVVYVVRATPDDERTDPVRVYGGFPARWRPTELPGQVLHDEQAPQQYYFCAVPRSQFRHYEQLTSSEALALYPALASRDD